MKFEYTDGTNRDFISLCYLLDEYLNEIAGGEENRSEYIPYNKIEDIKNVIIVYDGTIPIGCAGYKKYDNECAELKRVFVKKEYRGQGISKEMLKMMEQSAKEKGFSYMILESGEPLVEAMELYRTTGYRIIPNYGQYAGMTEAVCMKKKL